MLRWEMVLPRFVLSTAVTGVEEAAAGRRWAEVGGGAATAVKCGTEIECGKLEAD